MEEFPPRFLIFHSFWQGFLPNVSPPLFFSSSPQVSNVPIFFPSVTVAFCLNTKPPHSPRVLSKPHFPPPPFPFTFLKSPRPCIFPLPSPSPVRQDETNASVQPSTWLYLGIFSPPLYPRFPSPPPFGSSGTLGPPLVSSRHPHLTQPSDGVSSLIFHSFFQFFFLQSRVPPLFHSTIASSLLR